MNRRCGIDADAMLSSARLSIKRAWIAGVFAAQAAGQVTVRVNLDSTGLEANDASGRPSVSADARFVAFYSSANNLVFGDTNAAHDVFVRDRASGKTERASVGTGNVQGNLGSGHSTLAAIGHAISADGRFVAFASDATNLVGGDTNVSTDIFVRDRQLGTTERVSVDSAEAQADDDSILPSISADGRFVSFMSVATNLVAGDTNGFRDVFVRDRQLGTTERISLDSAGTQGNHNSGFEQVPISSDGRYVAFSSRATNLVTGDSNATGDVFVRDRLSGTTERMSVDSVGVQGNSDSSDYGLSISADGRYVAFGSHASNLVVGDTNSFEDVFVRDRQLGTTERVNVHTAGTQGNDDSGILGVSVSADGRHVAFTSVATSLVDGDTNSRRDLFVRDRQSGTTERISVDSAGVQGDDDSSFPSMSSDGRFVAFDSLASNLMSGDSNSNPDIFMRDRLGNSGAPMVQHCFPGTGGVIACPCGQPANPNGGCANFGAGSTSGAVMNASGDADLSADTLLLTTSNQRQPPQGILNVFFSYKPGALTPSGGMQSGSGVICTGAGGSLKRLYTVQVFGGSLSKPGMGDPSVSVRSAAFAGHAITPGETRHYFNVYRDGQAAGPCGITSVSTNATNMGSVFWVP